MFLKVALKNIKHLTLCLCNTLVMQIILLVFLNYPVDGKLAICFVCGMITQSTTGILVPAMD